MIVDFLGPALLGPESGLRTNHQVIVGPERSAWKHQEFLQQIFAARPASRQRCCSRFIFLVYGPVGSDAKLIPADAT